MTNSLVAPATQLSLAVWAEDEELVDGPFPIHMLHRGVALQGTTHLSVGDGAKGRVQVGQASLVDARGDGRPPFELVRWEPHPPEAIFEHIPRSVCPRDGVVDQVCELVSSLQTPELRRFMGDVFGIPDVFRYYWTCPASIRDHHCGPAGLVVHSLEIAVLASTIRLLTPQQRDMTICTGLLHDVGKLWSYESGQLTRDCDTWGHETLGFIYLRFQLLRLQESAPDIGMQMEQLLSGQWRRLHKEPAAVIGRLVNAMDRLSASKG